MIYFLYDKANSSLTSFLFLSFLTLLLHFLIFDMNRNNSHSGWFLTPNIWAMMLLPSCSCWCGCSSSSFLQVFICGCFKCRDNLDIIIAIVFGGGGRRASARCVIELLNFNRIILLHAKIGADWWGWRSDTRTLIHLRRQIKKHKFEQFVFKTGKKKAAS